MQWQLRLYRAKEGELEEFVREWRERVLPLRRAHGFDVIGPWVTEDRRFAWIVGHEDLAAADAEYYASAGRAAIVPDPARHLAETEHIAMEDA
jgi:NIPSNAP